MQIVEQRTERQSVGGVLWTTKYVRHHSRPSIALEPDLVHELIAHPATLAHPASASLSRAFGQAALEADKDRRGQIESLDW